MEVFNIIKPDMLNDLESFDYYLNTMQERFKINIEHLYIIPDWIKIAKLIYESDLQSSELNSEKLIEKRRELLITILGYNLYFKNQKAAVALYNIPINKKEVLEELTKFKKELRKKYVYQSAKHYIKIQNESEINYNMPLEDIDISKIKIETKTFPGESDELQDEEFKMAFFNRLHFPDANVESISRELKILRSQGIIPEYNDEYSYREQEIIEENNKNKRLVLCAKQR